MLGCIWKPSHKWVWWVTWVLCSILFFWWVLWPRRGHHLLPCLSSFKVEWCAAWDIAEQCPVGLFRRNVWPMDCGVSSPWVAQDQQYPTYVQIYEEVISEPLGLVLWISPLNFSPHLIPVASVTELGPSRFLRRWIICENSCKLQEIRKALWTLLGNFFTQMVFGLMKKWTQAVCVDWFLFNVPSQVGVSDNIKRAWLSHRFDEIGNPLTFRVKCSSDWHTRWSHSISIIWNSWTSSLINLGIVCC